ncbi:hypothetical protein Nepgr_017593 [Nepenthes gracilis]|uniref:Uncharacterized protein n=1 Tax=Nepenthes gracilis TaxID=150966 RepID=A0AAD3SSM5_NEPGR|nr:hypothetical protein Nepgr_017593 [Nepenthes gracilis]
MSPMKTTYSRYSSFKNSQSSTSSSTDLKSASIPKSSFIHHSSNSNSLKHGASIPDPRTNFNDIVKVKAKNEQNFAAMVKKFMEKSSKSKPKSNGAMPLIVPADFIAEDLKRTARKGSSTFSALPRKLFGKGAEKGSTETKKGKALTDVKANTRTLAMVLRSERELLSLNKDQEAEITELKSLLEERNREVEKLKDLCLKQREEIKALKSAILFPDEMNNQLQELLEKQGSELKQAKQVIPTLQRQITSLTGQLQILSEDLAEVKADKCLAWPYFEGDNSSSPQLQACDQEEAANSLDFSSADATAPGSPDHMFLKDMNPCLTPYSAKTKSKELMAMGYDSPRDKNTLERTMQIPHEIGSISGGQKLSRSSEFYPCSTLGSCMSSVARRSNESRCRNGKKMNHKFL